MRSLITGFEERSSAATSRGARDPRVELARVASEVQLEWSSLTERNRRAMARLMRQRLKRWADAALDRR
jgi:hypothetical protein